MIDTRIGGWQHLSWMDSQGYLETRADKIEAICCDLITAKHCGENINETQERYFRKHGINMDSLTEVERTRIRDKVLRG